MGGNPLPKYLGGHTKADQMIQQKECIDIGGKTETYQYVCRIVPQDYKGPRRAAPPHTTDQ